jgi:hypothetical protein
MSSTVIDLAEHRVAKTRETLFEVRIETALDPFDANRRYYRFRSESPGAIQNQIAAVTAEVESFGNGAACFHKPRLMNDGFYVAVGVVIVRPD